jgi:hypothetical protein
VTDHSLAPLVAKLRDAGDALSLQAADAIAALVTRQAEDARWQERAAHAERRAQSIGETSDERLEVLRRIWAAWWDDEPRTPRSKRRDRDTVVLDSPWWQAIVAAGDLVEPGWRDNDWAWEDFADKLRPEIRVSERERRAIAFAIDREYRLATEEECAEFVRDQFQAAVNALVHRHRIALREPVTEDDANAELAEAPVETDRGQIGLFAGDIVDARGRL